MGCFWPACFFSPSLCSRPSRPCTRRVLCEGTDGIVARFQSTRASAPRYAEASRPRRSAPSTPSRSPQTSPYLWSGDLSKTVFADGTGHDAGGSNPSSRRHRVSCSERGGCHRLRCARGMQLIQSHYLSPHELTYERYQQYFGAAQVSGAQITLYRDDSGTITTVPTAPTTTTSIKGMVRFPSVSFLIPFAFWLDATE